MRNSIDAIDYSSIAKQIEEILRSYGLSLDDFLSHLKLDSHATHEESECCSTFGTEDCCPKGQQLLDKVDDFDWDE